MRSIAASTDGCKSGGGGRHGKATGKQRAKYRNKRILGLILKDQ